MKQLTVFFKAGMLSILTLVITSCGSDDDDKKVDCDAVMEQITEYSYDLMDAIDSGDCNDIDDGYDNIISALQKLKKCDGNEAYAEEQIEVFEEQRDDVLEAFECD